MLGLIQGPRDESVLQVRIFVRSLCLSVYVRSSFGLISLCNDASTQKAGWPLEITASVSCSARKQSTTEKRVATPHYFLASPSLAMFAAVSLRTTGSTPQSVKRYPRSDRLGNAGRPSPNLNIGALFTPLPAAKNVVPSIGNNGSLRATRGGNVVGSLHTAKYPEWRSSMGALLGRAWNNPYPRKLGRRRATRPRCRTHRHCINSSSSSSSVCSDNNRRAAAGGWGRSGWHQRNRRRPSAPISNTRQRQQQSRLAAALSTTDRRRWKAAEEELARVAGTLGRRWRRKSGKQHQRGPEFLGGARRSCFLFFFFPWPGRWWCQRRKGKRGGARAWCWHRQQEREPLRQRPA